MNVDELIEMGEQIQQFSYSGFLPLMLIVAALIVLFAFFLTIYISNKYEKDGGIVLVALIVVTLAIICYPILTYESNTEVTPEYETWSKQVKEYIQSLDEEKLEIVYAKIDNKTA